MQKKLIEQEDFYYNEEGKIVMTEKYHLARGYCCNNGCKHCPYKSFSSSSQNNIGGMHTANVSKKED